MKVSHYRNEDDDSVITASETETSGTYDGLSFSKGNILAIYKCQKSARYWSVIL